MTDKATAVQFNFEDKKSESMVKEFEKMMEISQRSIIAMIIMRITEEEAIFINKYLSLSPQRKLKLRATMLGYICAKISFDE